MKLSKIVARKNADGFVPMVDYRASLHEAAQMMQTTRCSALMISDKDHFDPLQYKGLITAHNFIEALAKGVDPKQAKVEDYMVTRMIVGTGDDEADYLINVMVRHRLSHLPVVMDRKVAAIISLADILEIENLEKDIQLHWLSDFTGSPGGDRNKVF